MDNILSLTTHTLQACRETYQAAQDASLEAPPNNDLHMNHYIDDLSQEVRCICQTLHMVKVAKNAPGARLPSQMTKDLETLLEACGSICQDVTAFILEALTTNGMAHSYGGMWKEFYVILMTLNTCEYALKLAASSLNFVVNVRHNMAQSWRDIVSLRERISVQEKVIRRDYEASSTLGITLSELPLRRYLAGIESLLTSDPPIVPAYTDVAKASKGRSLSQTLLPIRPARDDVPDPNSVEGYGTISPLRILPEATHLESLSIETSAKEKEMEYLRSVMIARVIDWKNYNPSTFGRLLRTERFDGWRSPNFKNFGRKEVRKYHCYLFEKVLLACKATQNGAIVGQDNDGYRLQLKGRIFMRNILKVDRADCISADPFISISYEAIDTIRPFNWARFACKTKAIENDWYQTLNRLIQEAKVQS